MVIPLTAVANVATMLALEPVGLATYQISELLLVAPLTAAMAFVIEIPPTVMAVSWAVPAAVESSQLMVTTVVRLGLGLPTPWAVKVIVVPEEVVQALLTGVPVGPPPGTQKP